MLPAIMRSVPGDFGPWILWFISDTAFTSVEERARTPSLGTENYDLYGLVFASSVPEPATWAMMILGFLGVGFVAYRRKSNTIKFRIA